MGLDVQKESTTITIAEAERESAEERIAIGLSFSPRSVGKLQVLCLIWRLDLDRSPRYASVWWVVDSKPLS